MTYLVVAALSIGTLIGFGLGGAAIQTTVRQTYIGVDWQELEEDGNPPAGEPAPCLPPEVREYPTPRFDLVWGFLAANPYVVVADAAPGTFDEFGNPRDLFGWIAVGVRTAQHAPDTEAVVDECADWRPRANGSRPSTRPRRRSTSARCRRGSWDSRSTHCSAPARCCGHGAAPRCPRGACPPGAAWPEAQASGGATVRERRVVAVVGGSAARTSSSSPRMAPRRARSASSPCERADATSASSVRPSSSSVAGGAGGAASVTSAGVGRRP